MTALRYAAIAVALLSGTAVAQAQTVTTTTTTVERSAAPLQLLPEQRSTIYRTVTRERRVAQPAEVVEFGVGRRVPSTVVLQEFPREVYVETPALERYRYFYVNNQLVLVDPATSQVVDILDR